jgi:hypothetical protein
MQPAQLGARVVIANIIEGRTSSNSTALEVNTIFLLNLKH